VDDPRAVISAGFGARFVVVAKEHEGLARKLQASRSAVLRLATRDGWLFELTP
jgi:hypothetical protein